MGSGKLRIPALPQIRPRKVRAPEITRTLATRVRGEDDRVCATHALPNSCHVVHLCAASYATLLLLASAYLPHAHPATFFHVFPPLSTHFHLPYTTLPPCPMRSLPHMAPAPAFVSHLLSFSKFRTKNEKTDSERDDRRRDHLPTDR